MRGRYPITWMCAVLGIARASYYKWKNRPVPQKETEDRALEEKIREVYEAHKGIYGYRRIWLYLRLREGLTINHKRVYRIMDQLGLKAVIRRKRKRYVSSTPQRTAENVLNREFEAEEPNQKWLTDVTEFALTDGSKAYLSAVLDLGSNRIIAYQLGPRNNNPLVFDTIRPLLRNLVGSRPLLHSDRGFQYTSPTFQGLLREAGITQSMSRVGRCIDNGPMEAFWGTLKSELYYLNRYDTFAQLAADIAAYIRFFNEDRITLKMARAI